MDRNSSLIRSVGMGVSRVRNDRFGRVYTAARARNRGRPLVGRVMPLSRRGAGAIITRGCRARGDDPQRTRGVSYVDRALPEVRMTLRNPLFEFMPYGAPELLQAQRTHLLRAL